MASKGPRSKLDHDSRARCRKQALEAPREPPRPKTHWDHVLEEMVWLSKDFESERKWKIAQGKKVALRASKGMLDQATRGEKKMKEEEQRMRKVALNISKDVKKFWTKIEKLVLYKHRLELDDKKKKTLDKQLEYLLGQTERYSTMLAENLSCPSKQSGSIEPSKIELCHQSNLELCHSENSANSSRELHCDDESNRSGTDNDYDILSEDDMEDDEQTIEEDEALITVDERKEELAALQNEVDLPLEELLKRYTMIEVNGERSPEKDSSIKPSVEGVVPKDAVDSSCTCQMNKDGSPIISDHYGQSNGFLKNSENHSLEVVDAYQGKENRDLENGPSDYCFNDDQSLMSCIVQEDGEFLMAEGELADREEKDDETTLEEEEELAKVDSSSPIDEIALLQKESEIPLEELLARYKGSADDGSADDGSADDDSADDDDLSNTSAQLELGSQPEPDIKGELQATPMAGDDVSGDLPPTSPSLKDEALVGQSIVSEEGSEKENTIADAAAAARSAQPTGNTFSTTNVRTKFPFLLKYPLREYQHIGLDWLVTMYEKRLNGILADEMGLGKTIMTIALLAHLACEKGIWGPHLIVVPTSVMLNWETEFLKWCPAFKILTYFGSAKERKYKRQGWMKPNYFHVCITTYRLVIQDSKIFKRKKWKYLILDEAHLIKNWKSQRWQTLLNFNSKRRILLTGTPLQNDLMELWSLMHFLMPHVFQSHQEFKDWFCNPISGMVEGQEKVNVAVIDRLHNVLRPFILRRLKRDVEKQLPMKHEHVIYCRLSKRQRNLYEDFIASSETQATLSSSNFFGMLNVIMQLRKVCNHPDLFEGRPIISSFDMAGIERQFSSDVCSVLSARPFSSVDLSGLGLVFTHLDFCMTSWESDEVKSIATPSQLIKDRVNDNALEVNNPKFKHCSQSHDTNIFEEIRMAVFEERLKEARDRAAAIAWWNSLRCQKKPTYSTTLRELVTVRHPVDQVHYLKSNTRSYHYSKLADIVLSPVERFQSVIDQVESFMFSIPAARAPPLVCWCSKSESPVFISPSYKERCSEVLLPLLTPLRPAIVRRQLYFPDRRLLQFDCGKLQQLAILLRRLKSEGHRALIFTQMTKMLDILEAFINLYGYTYMRLDGSTQPEERQTSMQRFNTNPKIFLFILSTRSGGVGINLVGADTVIFYDSDWNPAMDQQAQDRCHRIGQTREVNIYRLISESTIEENILKKANQKRALDDLVIQSGGYNTEFFKKLDPMELFSGHKIDPIKDVQKEKSLYSGNVDPVSNYDLEAALRFAEDEADYMALKRVELEEAVDNQEFTEENIGRLEDDDLANDDDTRVDDPSDQKVLTIPSNKETEAPSKGNDPDGEKALAFVCNDDDVDMLADVKQMAEAAAAAGHSVSTFENQLRPIDRYAMQFLEMWDPIIDKAALVEQTKFEETEWELERIEKLKEDMEAEIDEDEEPLVYERWDADFATQAYRQQVEALAQHQLMEEMERKAKEQEILEDVDDFVENEETTASKPKSKKSKKKTKKVKKLKSLKNESMHPTTNSVMEEYMDSMLSDDENTCSEGEGAVSVDMVSSDTRIQKKRKAEENNADSGEKILKHKAKKAKKVPLSQCLPNNMSKMSGKLNDETRGSKLFEVEGVDLELRQASRSKTGKISIINTPTKRILMIRQEKPRKKGSIWSSNCYPSPDAWLPQEDAVLCALVHEYGSNWSLVSDSLYGMTAGGFYRGRFRHPFHCCERYRDLVQKFVLSVADNLNNDKSSNTGAGKALLRVSEENIRTLLETVTELQDREMLLQRHFTALLSSIWRTTARHNRKNCLSVPQNSVFGLRKINASSSLYGGQNIAAGSSGKMKFTNVSECRRLVGGALLDADSSVPSDFDETNRVTKKKEVISQTWGILEVTLELGGGEKDESIDGFPSTVTLSILDADPPLSMTFEENQLKACQHIVEERFRSVSNGYGLSWGAVSGFPGESRPRSAPALALGKHKLPAVEVNKTSRSKLRKTATEPFSFENRSFAMVVEEPLPLPEHATPPSFDPLPPVFPQHHLTRDFTENTQFFSFGLDAVEPSDAPNSDLVPHFYSPDFISGLEDCLLLPEFTDIG